MKPAALLCMVALIAGGAACGARTKAPIGKAATLRPACPAGERWAEERCQPRGDSGAVSLRKGAEALQGFQVEQALELLERARDTGPHRYSDYVRIHEQIGIAHSYLGAEPAALDAFDMLLSLAPGHLLSYTLSPKATFVFERAREQAKIRSAPSLDLSWPRDLEVDQPVPIDVEVVADPKSFFQRAELRVRRRGDATFNAVDLRLPQAGTYERVVLPALDSQKPEVLELYLTAFDSQGNEVFRWASPQRPREIDLGYQPPTPWYRKWWVWASIGGALAAGTGTAVYLISQDPPDTVDGRLEIP